MAKRDIPEINAGSMADIAFLLLIFFLVTTTMDRDQAYKRKIPKKIDIPPPPEPTMPRDIFAIKANDQGNVTIVDRVARVKDLETISDKVVEFYEKNRYLTLSQSQAAMGNSGHPGYNFPFYSRITEEYINQQLDFNNTKLEESEDADNEDLIEFYSNVLKEWGKKKKALKMYGKGVLPEISPRAHLRIEVQKGTHYELFVKFHSEIEEAIYDLRDIASKDIFSESYGNIVQRWEVDRADKNKRLQVKEDRDKLDLLEILYPSTIIEVTPK